MPRLTRLNLGSRVGTHPATGLVARKRHPLFGTAIGVSPVTARVKVISGPVYSAATGSTPLTRAELLADPYVREGKISNPPADVVAMLLMDRWTVSMATSTPFGTVSASGVVTRTASYTVDNEVVVAPNFDDPEAPNYVDPERERYYAPNAAHFADPVIKFEKPSFPLVYGPNLANLAVPWGPGFPGGAWITSTQYFRAGIIALSAFDAGELDETEVETGIPIGDPADGRTYKLRFGGSIGNQSVQATATMYQQAWFCARYDAWVLPFGTAGQGVKWSLGAPSYDDLFNVLYEDHSETLDALIAAHAADFESANPDEIHRIQPAGRSAVTDYIPGATIDYDEGPIVAEITDPVFYPPFTSFQIP